MTDDARFKPIPPHIQRSMYDKCPYCSNLFAVRSQKMRMYATEPQSNAWMNESPNEKAANHPEFLMDYTDFEVLTCMGCGFTRMFAVPS